MSSNVLKLQADSSKSAKPRNDKGNYILSLVLHHHPRYNNVGNSGFIESESYEDAVRNAISIGGDSDTLACIAGGIAEAFYGALPKDISETAMNILDENLRETVVRFHEKYIQV
ncbi:MAG: ADP-ribosylglycohydrolase family protein [Alphaproteobacteria bacterium]|nr:ADP-ribosylglycohydrolase family protein [Alphaproteobacteria bacterium]